ncbi:MAG: HAMP domain-containing sensor histidine kinase [Polyangiaceae bacterium]
MSDRDERRRRRAERVRDMRRLRGARRGPPWAHHHWHGHGHWSHTGGRWGFWLKARLHRRLFFWLGMTLLVMMFVAGTAGRLLVGGATPWKAEQTGISHFVGERFARVWDRPAERAELMRSMGYNFRVDIELKDQAGVVVDSSGRCADPDMVVPVRDVRGTLGTVNVCMRSHAPPHAVRTFFITLGVATMVLWMSAGFFARRFTRPLSRLVDTAREIGEGKLSSRTHLTPREAGEVGVLAEAIDHMAGRIERQLQEHKELLAAVSHEVRTPLARLRVLVELLRENPDAALLDDVEQEVLEIDRLMSELIATSRLDFQQLDPRTLPLAELVERARERAGLEQVPITDRTERAEVRVDPTLIARALANLLENARRHAGGVERIEVERSADGVLVVRVLDSGPGFSEGELERAFQAFHRRRGGGLGLGLALVRRIAEAHGGKAWAENRSEGGARLCLELPTSDQSKLGTEPLPG